MLSLRVQGARLRAAGLPQFLPQIPLSPPLSFSSSSSSSSSYPTPLHSSISPRDLIGSGVEFGSPRRTHRYHNQHLIGIRDRTPIFNVSHIKMQIYAAATFAQRVARSGGMVYFTSRSDRFATILKEGAVHCRQRVLLRDDIFGGIFTARMGEGDFRPSAIFVPDVKRNVTLVKEALGCHIPVIGIVNTDCPPIKDIPFPIHCSDESFYSVNFITKFIASAIQSVQQAEFLPLGYAHSTISVKDYDGDIEKEDWEKKEQEFYMEWVTRQFKELDELYYHSRPYEDSYQRPYNRQSREGIKWAEVFLPTELTVDRVSHGPKESIRRSPIESLDEFLRKLETPLKAEDQPHIRLMESMRATRDFLKQKKVVDEFDNIDSRMHSLKEQMKANPQYQPSAEDNAILQMSEKDISTKKEEVTKAKAEMSRLEKVAIDVTAKSLPRIISEYEEANLRRQYQIEPEDDFPDRLLKMVSTNLIRQKFEAPLQAEADLELHYNQRPKYLSRFGNAEGGREKRMELEQNEITAYWYNRSADSVPIAPVESHTEDTFIGESHSEVNATSPLKISPKGTKLTPLVDDQHRRTKKEVMEEAKMEEENDKKFDKKFNKEMKIALLEPDERPPVKLSRYQARNRERIEQMVMEITKSMKSLTGGGGDEEFGAEMKSFEDLYKEESLSDEGEDELSDDDDDKAESEEEPKKK